MKTQLTVAAVVLTALFSLSACGGGDAEPEPAATSTTPATPTKPVQPKGADGVTFDILNFEDYADDPAVLAWKKTNEAINASVNLGKLVPAARDGVNEKVLNQFLPSVQKSWKRGWHVDKVAQARVVSSKTTGDTSNLVICFWAPSSGYYDKNGKYVGAPEEFWTKEVATLQLTSGKWILTNVAFDGKCPGGAPA